MRIGAMRSLTIRSSFAPTSRTFLVLTLGCLCSSSLASTATARSITTAQSSADPVQSVQPWRRIRAPLALEFPRDHGSHPDCATEWWYATGDLRDASGHAFGYELTIFRRGLDARPLAPGESRLRPREMLAAHLAIVDIERARTIASERLRRACAGLAGAATHDLRAWVEDWRIERLASGVLRLHAVDVARDIAIDLELEPTKPLVLHGDGGVSQKSAEPGNASAYASWTRLRTRGRIRAGAARPAEVEVTGESWFDHEFGSSQIAADVAGWEWMGLRFDDGRELTLYRMRAKDARTAPWSQGTLVEQSGGSRRLGATDFVAEPTSRWRSARTGTEYPVEWKIAVPSAGIACEVVARVRDCELDTRASVGTIYWEGPVSVAGSTTGSGYLELTGYAGELSGKF